MNNDERDDELNGHGWTLTAAMKFIFRVMDERDTRYEQYGNQAAQKWHSSLHGTPLLRLEAKQYHEAIWMHSNLLTPF